MKRFEIQKQIAKAARTVASKFANGTSKADPYYASRLAGGGEINSALGLVLSQAGLIGPKAHLYGAKNGLAKALNTTPELLPSGIDAVVSQLTDASNRPTPKGRRSQSVKPLRTLADILVAAPIRKPYSRQNVGGFTPANGPSTVSAAV